MCDPLPVRGELIKESLTFGSLYKTRYTYGTNISAMNQESCPKVSLSLVVIPCQSIQLKTN